MPDCCVFSSDGYSTIDHRDKERKYKSSDNTGDASEKEPLKVSSSYCWVLLSALGGEELCPQPETQGSHSPGGCKGPFFISHKGIIL